MEGYPFATILAAVLAVCFMGRVWRALNRERAENRRLRSLLQPGGREEPRAKRLRDEINKDHRRGADEFRCLYA